MGMSHSLMQGCRKIAVVKLHFIYCDYSSNDSIQENLDALLF